MDPSHKASKNPSDNADLGFQAVGPALRIMQLNVERLSAAKRHIIQSLAERSIFTHTSRRIEYWHMTNGWTDRWTSLTLDHDHVLIVYSSMEHVTRKSPGPMCA